jgi:methionine synthase I (cobalamin-dependent)
VDDQLADHLKAAEEHLIAAVELFTNAGRPSRESGYRSRLIQAQESVTALYAKELIRIRGPQRPEKKR